MNRWPTQRANARSRHTISNATPIPRILILSSERSGSNLLREMLGAHSQLGAPPAVHFTTHLAPWAGFYGRLNDVSARRRLIEDLIAVAQSHIAPWPGPYEVGQVEQFVQRPTFWGVVDALYRVEAARLGKVGWACKDNGLWDHAAEIALQFPDVRAVHLVRDGRDVAASFRRAPGGPKTIYAAASQWAREQRAALRVADILGDRCVRLKYEQLTGEPEATLRSMCQAIDLDFDPAMLEYHRQGATQDLASRSSYWSNLGQPVIRDNAGRYRQVFSSQQARRYEQVAGGELASMGYALDHATCEPWTPRKIRRGVDMLVDAARQWRARRRAGEECERSTKRHVVRKIHQRLRRAAIDAAATASYK